MLTQYLLIFINFTLIIGMLNLALIRDFNIRKIKRVGLIYAFVVLILTLLMHICFNVEKNTFSFRLDLLWTIQKNTFLSLGIDGISIFFIILTALLIPICMLIS